MNTFLRNGGNSVSTRDNIKTFRDSKRCFKIDGDLLETIINYDFNVDHSNQQDQKLIYEFGNEMKFDNKQKGRRSDRDKFIIRLLKSPAIMASGVTTIIKSENPDQLCNKLKLLLQEKHAGNNSDLINKEIVAIVDKLLE